MSSSPDPVDPSAVGEFTPQTERRVRFEVDRIPPTLYEAVKAKAKREGVSLAEQRAEQARDALQAELEAAERQLTALKAEHKKS